MSALLCEAHGEEVEALRDLADARKATIEAQKQAIESLRGEVERGRLALRVLAQVCALDRMRGEGRLTGTEASWARNWTDTIAEGRKLLDWETP